MRANDRGFDWVLFSIVEYAALKQYDILFSVGMRLNKVQELVNQMFSFHQEEQKNKNLTCIVDIGSFTGNHDLKFETFSTADIETAVDRFWEIYIGQAEKYIQNCYDLAFLNRIFPEHREKANRWLTAFQCYVTVPTVAWLADGEGFADFRQAYTKYLVECHIPEDKLDELNSYLDRITQTSL